MIRLEIQQKLKYKTSLCIISKVACIVSEETTVLISGAGLFLMTNEIKTKSLDCQKSVNKISILRSFHE